MTEREIFMAALNQPDPAARAALLDSACGDDQDLRGRIEELLQEQEQLGSFLERPAEGVARTAVFSPVPGGEIEVLPDQPGSVIGPYKLLQQIGEGGMGVVFMAEQTQPVQRKVALKIIKPGMDSRQVIARFEAERQALALMDHPNIARVLDAGTTDGGRPYFVMELVKGVPITRFCDECRLSPRQRLELFVPVCQAVQHAHQKGIIHRDLKPSNVLLALYDDKPVAKVIDFGIAKATGQKLTERTLFTEFGQVVGTLEYMSPEQAGLNQLDIDTRSDIYSLGVLLYELLTGTTPLERKRLKEAALLEMLRLIREEEPPKPSTRLSTTDELPSVAANRGLEPKKLSGLVRGELDWIVMKALDKDRNRRYETANGLAMDVQRYLADEPVQAGPPSTTYRFKKFLRRNKGPVLAASLVLLALVGAVLGTSIGLVQAEEARHEADQRRIEADLAYTKEAAERKRANTEWARAEQEKRIAEAVRDFLRYKLIRQADTREQADTLLRAGRTAAEVAENPSIRELLDRAAKELTADTIEVQFPRQPLVQAELLDAIGDTYRAVGGLEQAIAHLERALRIRETQLGPDHPDSLSTLHNLARAYTFAGKPKQAIPLLERVREKNEAKLAPDHPHVLATVTNLAGAYLEIGKSAEAIRLFKYVREKQEAKLGPDHADIVVTLNNLGVAYWYAGDLPEAFRLLHLAREKCEARLGPHHPNTLTTLINLAGAYQEDGKFPETIRLFGQVHKTLEGKLGPDHPHTLTAWICLAMAHRDAGNLPQATRLLQQVREKAEAKFGPDHPKTLYAQLELALALEPPQGIRLLEQVRPKIEAKFGLDHPHTLTMLSNLAGLYGGSGKLREGIRMYEQVREKRQANLGPDHRDTLTAVNNLAAMYWRARQLDRSVPLFEWALEKQVAKRGRDHPETLLTMANLGVNYRDAGRLAEGLPLLEEALSRARKLPGGMPAYLGWMPKQLASTYDQAGNFAKSEPMYRDFLEQARRKFGADHVQTGSALSDLGQQLLKQAKFVEAEAVLRECLAILDKKLPDEWGTFRAKSMLGGALLGQEKNADAEPLLLEGYRGMKKREATIPTGGSFCQSEAIERVVKLYEAKGPKNQADDWRHQLQTAKLVRRVWEELQYPKSPQLFIESKHQGSLNAQKRKQVHTLALRAGKTYVLDLESEAFDTFLILEDGDGAKLAANDDISPGYLNSRIIHPCQTSGSYRAVVMSFQPGEAGAYLLRIRELTDAKERPEPK